MRLTRSLRLKLVACEQQPILRLRVCPAGLAHQVVSVCVRGCERRLGRATLSPRAGVGGRR